MSHRLVLFTLSHEVSLLPLEKEGLIQATTRPISHKVRIHLLSLYFLRIHSPYRHTLPRSGLQFLTPRDPPDNSRGVPEHSENPRQRSQSMGAPHPLPSSNRTPSERPPPIPSVARPPRKSSLVPISGTTRLSSSSASELPNRPPLTRESSALSLQTPTVKTLKAKRSMPELQLGGVWESFVEEANATVVTPTRCEFRRDGDTLRGVNRQRRSPSIASERLSLKQRFSDLPESPSPTIALPSLPGNTSPVVDLSSPRKSRFGSRYSSSKDDFPLNTPPLPEDPTTEVTLSMFPQPPPLTIRHHRPLQSTGASQYPITPDYSPSATPTSPTFQHSNHYQSKRTSILKKSSSFYNPLPTPPITPNSSFASSRSGSNGSLSIILPAPDPIAPTLRICASSPYLPSAKPTLHTVHRSSSSDSSSDKPEFPGSSSSERHRIEQQHLQKRIMSRLEIPPAQKAVFEASLPEPIPYQTQTPQDTRPVSPESVQWGYAV